MSEVTDGLTASVGVGTSKFIAKVASDLDKPDGLVVVAPGTEQDLLRPMHVTVIPGVGPATAERLRRVGIHTVAELETVSEEELVRLLGKASGHWLFHLARAEDDRPIVSERETKSVSAEGTYDTDLTDRKLMEGLLTRQAGDVATRLRKSGLSGRTMTIKVRMHDFTTLSRSTTLSSPTDSPGCDRPDGARPAHRPRHLGRGTAARRRGVRAGRLDPGGPLRRDRCRGGRRHPRSRCRTSSRRTWGPGMDVEHAELGRGWVWGAGRGVVTVRFETRESPEGPVRSFAQDDPDAQRVAATGTGSGSRLNSTRSPGRSCAHCHRSSGWTTPITG